jgi:hypothetical protein
MGRFARGFAVGLAVLSLSGTASMAQAKPDFSGKWAVVERPSDRVPDSVLTITQDTTTLTMIRTGGTIFTYRLGGSDSKNVFKNLAGNTIDTVSKASWDGTTLVIVTLIDIGHGPPFAQSERLSLDVSGHLVFELSSPPKTRTATPSLNVQTWMYKKS